MEYPTFASDENGFMFAYFCGTKGFLNQSDFQQLMTHAKSLPDGAEYAETGSFMGASALIFGLNSTANVWCHDIWTLDQNIKEVEYPSENFFNFYDKIREYNLLSRVFLVPGDSLKTYKVHKDKSLDLAFIDGDHSYSGALGDLENFLPKVKEGGIILAHDCTPGSECLRALNDFSKKNSVKFEILPGTNGMAKIIVNED